MSKKDRTILIERVMTGNPPAPEFRMTEDGKVIAPDVPIIFNKNVDKLKKVDHYRIRFKLADPANTNLRFIPSLQDVMWAHKLGACPTSFCELPGEFWTDKIDKNREWIDVINMDLKVEEFHFTLNFADKSVQSPTPADYVPLDPVGGNQNGGGSGSGRKVTAAAAISLGVVAGLVSFVGAQQFLTGY